MLNSMFQKNGIKFLNYTVFSLNYFITIGNDESNNSGCNCILPRARFEPGTKASVSS